MEYLSLFRDSVILRMRGAGIQARRWYSVKLGSRLRRTAEFIVNRAQQKIPLCARVGYRDTTVVSSSSIFFRLILARSW